MLAVRFHVESSPHTKQTGTGTENSLLPGAGSVRQEQHVMPTQHFTVGNVKRQNNKRRQNNRQNKNRTAMARRTPRNFPMSLPARAASEHAISEPEYTCLSSLTLAEAQHTFLRTRGCTAAAALQPELISCSQR
jgi:hypothetical protein